MSPDPSTLAGPILRFVAEPSGGVVVFAMGTLKKRPKQWILLGLIRLDATQQASFAF